MQVRSILATSVLIAAALHAGGCSRNASPPPTPDAGPNTSTAEGPENPRSAKLLPLPGDPALSSGATAQSSELVWDLPADWIEQRPASSMRRAQYGAPGPGGDGLCIVFYFGPGQGGDAASNAARWAGQFTQPDGSSSLDRMQVARLDGTRVPVEIVEVTGTYDGGMTMTDAPARSMADYMLLGGIAQGGDALWFFKLTGPEATLRAQRASFLAMMRSIRPGS